MSRNKQTVQRYMEAFTRLDHAEILSCLTDDIQWVVPGIFHLTGKIAFDKEKRRIGDRPWVLIVKRRDGV